MAGSASFAHLIQPATVHGGFARTAGSSAAAICAARRRLVGVRFPIKGEPLFNGAEERLE